MNYTENFRLPQWEESDRVLREDFNQMCAHIEEGLCAGGRGLEEEEALVFERLCRTAYNHYQCVKGLSPFPRQLGVFFQKFGKNAGSASGMTQQDGYCFMGGGGEGVTIEAFSQTIDRKSEMVVVKNTSTTSIVAEFTAPAPGRFIRLPIYGTYSVCESNGGPCQVTLYNMTEGKNERTLTVDMGLKIITGMMTSALTPEVDIPFHGGHQYRLTISPLTRDYNATLKLSTLSSYYVELYTSSGASVPQALNAGENSRGGLVIVRYKSFGVCSLRLNWDGEDVPIWKTFSFTEGGASFQEAVFRTSGKIPAESTATLELNCGVNGELALYTVGAVLI